MPLHIVDAAGEDKAVAGIIAHIARLQILIGGFQSIIAYFVGAVKDQFQLIHLLQGKFAVKSNLGEQVIQSMPSGTTWVPLVSIER